MPVATKYEYLKCLKKSGIATDELIALWTESIPDDANSKTTADSLVDFGHLTAWQAKYLLSGRSKLKFGSYILLERIKRNEIGDTFVALHLKLDRKVKILFLSQALSDRLNERDQLLRQVAATTDIDHPSLEHLHVIELESGRFLVVTDYVDAQTLNEPDLLARLLPDDLQKILVQAMEATAFAHEYGLSHGAMTENDLAFDPAGKLVVQNMATSCLVQNLALQHSDPVSKIGEDVAAIQKIGKRLLSRLGHAATRKEKTDRISEILDQLSDRKFGLKHAAAAIRNLENEPFSQTTTDSAISSSQLTDDTSVAAGQGGHEFPNKREQRFSRAHPFRRAMQASAAILTLALIGYLGVTVWFNETGDITPNQTAKLDESASQLPALNADWASHKQAPAADSIKTNLPPRPRENSTNSHLIPTTLADDDASTNNALLADRDTDEPPVAITDQAILNKNSELESKPDDKNSGDSILNAFNDLSGDGQANEGTKPTNPVTPSQTELDNPDAQPIDNNKPVASPSDAIPLHINLPPPSSLDVISVATVPSGSYTLELISDKNISKSKIGFALSDIRNSIWSVTAIGKTQISNDPIAEFSLLGDQLQFAWNENASDCKDAPYLGNCILKVGTTSSASYINLRKPIPINGFVLNREKPHVKIELPTLDHLPADPITELHQLDEETYGTVFLADGREDRSFSRKDQLVVHFRDLPEYQMLFLLLSSDLKNKSRLEASLNLQLDPTQKPRTATLATIESAKQYLEDYLREVTSGHDELKAMPIDELRARLNVSKDVFKNAHKLARVKELKKVSEISENRFKAFREIQTQLEAFYEMPLPVSIYFEVQGRRVVLATSVNQ